MLRLLCPASYVSSIFDVDVKALAGTGVKGIILDLDNTLIHWRSDTPGPEVLDWFKMLKARGLQACIVSNNMGPRVRHLAGIFGIPCIPRAAKPRRRAFREAMDIMGTSPQETAVVGDQVFTDILGANRLGLLSVLVVPISSREFIGTRLVRVVERLVLFHLARKGMLTPPSFRCEPPPENN
ncbi:MAG: YqeG family HAD IIIA-type phosphatase [Bacillota bacterium]